MPTWNPLAQVVAVCIREKTDEQRAKEVNHIVQLFFAYRMLDVNVITIMPAIRRVQLHTWYPYGSGRCANRVGDATVVEECLYDSNGLADLLGHTPLQPKIPRKLHQCELKVAATMYEPYIFHDKKRGFYDGIEYHLIKMIAKALEMNVTYFLLNETRENRFVSNETGLYSQLIQR